jgi:hypothetical protein
MDFLAACVRARYSDLSDRKTCCAPEEKDPFSTESLSSGPSVRLVQLPNEDPIMMHLYCVLFTTSKNVWRVCCFFLPKYARYVTFHDVGHQCSSYKGAYIHSKIALLIGSFRFVRWGLHIVTLDPTNMYLDSCHPVAIGRRSKDSPLPQDQSDTRGPSAFGPFPFETVLPTSHTLGELATGPHQTTKRARPTVQPRFPPACITLVRRILSS